MPTFSFGPARVSGRTGPGSGRPAKLYRRSARQVQLAFPPREYELAARLLATALAESERTGRPPRQSVRNAARAVGEQLANCPFEALARAHSALICGMNVELLVSLADALPMLRLKPRLDPGPDRCCVTFARSGA